MGLLVGPPALGEAPTLSVSRIPSLGGRGVLSVAQPYRYLNLLADGDMELIDTSAWTAGGGGVLSKQTTDPHGGSRSLRVAGVITGFAYQPNVAVIGKKYSLVGWARGDGTATPSVNQTTGAAIWVGTSSASWQPFSVQAVAAGVSFLYRWGLGAGGSHVEFDDLLLARHIDIGLLVDGDMEAVDTNAWTPENSPTLTKETTDPHSGLRCLRVSYNGVTNPGAYQDVLTVGKTYRMVGYARSDGTAPPYVLFGSKLVFTGTDSTAWQAIDVTDSPTGVGWVRIRAQWNAGYVEFDDLLVYEV